MLKHKNIESFLPVFNGFYNTIFEADEDRIIESPYKYEDYEYDYEGYKNNVGKACCDAIKKKLIEFGIKGITLKYQNTSSPKEYNFATDSFNVKYKLTDVGIRGINTYLIDNKDAFTKYIKDAYTSRDGFMSWHSNDAYEWLHVKLSDKKELSHCFGAVLDFIFENEGYEAINLYEDIESEVWLEGWLKEGIAESDEFIVAYANDNYKIKDITTITSELIEHFEANDLIPEYEFLTYGYIENKVLEVFKKIDNKTLDLFRVK